MPQVLGPLRQGIHIDSCLKPVEWDVKSEPARALLPAPATRVQASTGELTITLVYAWCISTAI
jgi:hypothetical protein